jgi:hypothetical protein
MVKKEKNEEMDEELDEELKEIIGEEEPNEESSEKVESVTPEVEEPTKPHKSKRGQGKRKYTDEQKKEIMKVRVKLHAVRSVFTNNGFEVKRIETPEHILKYSFSKGNIKFTLVANLDPPYDIKFIQE